VLRRISANDESLHYHYDRALRLLKLVNANDEAYHFGYDAESRLISETGFDGKITTYTYDSAGQLTASECNGQRTDYLRDALGLLQAKTTAQGITRYAYDALDRLTSVARPDARQHFSYDGVGQLIEERVAYALARNPGKASRADDGIHTGFKLTHSYDTLGNRLQTTLPNGRTVDTQRYGSGHWHSPYDNTPTDRAALPLPGSAV
jgi:YD repeat-containing protein